MTIKSDSSSDSSLPVSLSETGFRSFAGFSLLFFAGSLAVVLIGVLSAVFTGSVLDKLLISLFCDFLVSSARGLSHLGFGLGD